MPQVDLKDNIEAMLDLIQTPNSPQSSEAFAEEWVKMFKDAGFKAVETYTNLKHIKHHKGVPERFYFVAVK